MAPIVVLKRGCTAAVGPRSGKEGLTRYERTVLMEAEDIHFGMSERT